MKFTELFKKKGGAAAPDCVSVLSEITARLRKIEETQNETISQLDETTDRLRKIEAKQNETSLQFGEITDKLRKIEAKQKETSLQLDEISGFLQDGGDADQPLLDALISTAGCVEAFYRFAGDEGGPALFAQAEMMWNAAREAAASAGLDLIDDEGGPFDFRRNTAESSEPAEGLPAGYVLRTLKCGYIYREEVIRRASVVVSKPWSIKTESPSVSEEYGDFD